MGMKTWVRLPKDKWLAAWCGLADPIAPLVLALCGHPDVGSCWETWNEEKMKKLRFRTADGWPGCYMHPQEGRFMTVYVDDCKLAEPSSAVSNMWKRIAGLHELGGPDPSGREDRWPANGSWRQAFFADAAGLVVVIRTGWHDVVG